MLHRNSESASPGGSRRNACGPSVHTPETRAPHRVVRDGRVRPATPYARPPCRAAAGRGRPRPRPAVPVVGDPTDEILAAASRLFGERGVAGTTMSQIASRGRAAAVVALLLLPEQGGDRCRDRGQGQRRAARAGRAGRSGRRLGAGPAVPLRARRRRGAVRAAVRHQRGAPLRRPRPRALRRLLERAPARSQRTLASIVRDGHRRRRAARRRARAHGAHDHVERRGACRTGTASTRAAARSARDRHATWPTWPSAACSSTPAGSPTLRRAADELDASSTELSMAIRKRSPVRSDGNERETATSLRSAPGIATERTSDDGEQAATDGCRDASTGAGGRHRRVR